ncbi:MAG: transposase, partial [Mycobacterium sp.]
MRRLYERVAVSLADPQVAGGFYRSWRLMSIDGLCLDVADTVANVERFGRPPSSRGGGRGGAFPQVRVLGLAECGSHAIIDAAIGTYRQGEQTLAESVLRPLRPGMLLLADRGFFSYPLLDKARATGAELLWRLKSNAVLPVETRYIDGSFASHIYPGTKARRNHTDAIAVRVIEYTLAPSDTGTEGDRTYRLLTTITDPNAAPRRRTGAVVHPAMGDRNRLRRAQDPPARSRARARYRQDLWISEFQATSDPAVSGSAFDVSGVMSTGRSSNLPLW